MSKSMIYTVQTGIVEVSDGGIIPLGTTIHRFGQNLRQDGNTVAARNINAPCGYYVVDVIAEMEAATAGPVTVTVLKDGAEVIGADTTITAPATAVLPYPVHTEIRLEGRSATANLSVRVDGSDVKVVGMTVRIAKD